ncbi:MAG: hypothetical protein Q8P11_01865, partial [bacterium]|nr:hypothetical protein [bacterium]
TFVKIVRHQWLSRWLRSRRIIILANEFESQTRESDRMLRLTPQLEYAPITNRQMLFDMVVPDASVAYSLSHASESVPHGGTMFVIGNEWIRMLVLPYIHTLNIWRIGQVGNLKDDIFDISDNAKWRMSFQVRMNGRVGKQVFDYFLERYTRRELPLDLFSSPINTGITQYVYPGNATNKHEANLVENYQARGVCHVCMNFPDHTYEIYVDPTKRWSCTKHMWDDNSYIIYPHRHIDHVSLLTVEERIEWPDVIKRTEKRYGIKGCCIEFFSGNILHHTSTAAHLHCILREKKDE